MTEPQPTRFQVNYTDDATYGVASSITSPAGNTAAVPLTADAAHQLAIALLNGIADWCRHRKITPPAP